MPPAQQPARVQAARVALVLALAWSTLVAPPAPAAAAPPPGTTAGPLPAPVRPPAVKAVAWLVADATTGQVLAARNPDQRRPMASTTKVMTALLSLEHLDLDRGVSIGPGPAAVGEESLNLRVGERFTVRQLLQGLLLKSANDAAVALAEAVDGSEAAFVRRMNRRAKALGMRATTYVTPYGLDRPGHATSARDLARVWNAAMRLAAFRALVATRTARLPGGRSVVTTNELLGGYRWTLGGKTGFTNLARRCLVATARRGGRHLVAVALGSPNAFVEVQALFEYGYRGFVRARLAAPGDTVTLQSASGTPATFTVQRSVDALVRRDQLARVAVSVGLGPGGEPRGMLVVGATVLGRLTLAPATGAAQAGPPRPRPLPSGVVPAPIDPFLAASAAPASAG
jgi:serine-type D-Ala-D-Ala carboxypeptidase (penicillin-binding protein 5/6)